MDPHHTHDLYLTESIIVLPRTDTHLLISTPGGKHSVVIFIITLPATTSGGKETLLPAHKLLPELFLAGLAWLTVVDVVESVDTGVVPANDISQSSVRVTTLSGANITHVGAKGPSPRYLGSRSVWLCL